MPLQPEALRRVKQELRELFEAYMAGFMQRYAHDVSSELETLLPGVASSFRSWLERTHPLLLEYVTYDLLHEWITNRGGFNDTRKPEENQAAIPTFKGADKGV